MWYIEVGGRVTNNGAAGPGWRAVTFQSSQDGVTVNQTLQIPTIPLDNTQPLANRYTLYRRAAKPAARAKFTHPVDGSKWIYPADGTGKYYCWKSGSTYTQGMLVWRTDVDGTPTTGTEPLPSADYDFIPVVDVTTLAVNQVGINQWAVIGTVASTYPVVNAPTWVGFNIVRQVDGGSSGIVFPPTSVDELGRRMYAYAVLNRPAAGATARAGDGSWWINPDDGDGLYLCVSSGDKWAQGAKATRGQVIQFAGTLQPGT